MGARISQRVMTRMSRRSPRRIWISAPRRSLPLSCRQSRRSTRPVSTSLPSNSLRRAAMRGSRGVSSYRDAAHRRDGDLGPCLALQFRVDGDTPVQLGDRQRGMGFHPVLHGLCYFRRRDCHEQVREDPPRCGQRAAGVLQFVLDRHDVCRGYGHRPHVLWCVRAPGVLS